MRPNSVLVVASFCWLLVSFWHRNDLPRDIGLVPAVAAEPAQTPTRREPFDVRYEGTGYRIEPEYAYELTGMVVSFRHHEGNSRMHRRAGDRLNMLDVCVVWGDNPASPHLHKLDFWNGIFTCNVKTRDSAAWASFDMNQLSNNHLISDDDSIRERVRGIRVGDQVRFRGLLASYTSEKGARRGTSTTRTDTGDGACETVFVEEFSIVHRATNYWRISLYVSLALLAAGLVIHFRRPYRPY